MRAHPSIHSNRKLYKFRSPTLLLLFLLRSSFCFSSSTPNNGSTRPNPYETLHGVPHRTGIGTRIRTGTCALTWIRTWTVLSPEASPRGRASLGGGGGGGVGGEAAGEVGAGRAVQSGGAFEADRKGHRQGRLPNPEDSRRLQSHCQNRRCYRCKLWFFLFLLLMVFEFLVCSG
jgi:hypothetical protein